MLFPSDIASLARQVIEAAAREKKRIVTAESCTGGLLAAALTSIPGASNVFDRGFVSYSEDSKIDLLGVLPETLKRRGPVSEETAEEMAQGALDYSQADRAVSITGIAGPGGGSADKPVGLVCFGVATREGARFHLRHIFKGDRDEVRRQSVVEALKLLLSLSEGK